MTVVLSASTRTPRLSGYEDCGGGAGYAVWIGGRTTRLQDSSRNSARKFADFAVGAAVLSRLVFRMGMLAHAELIALTSREIWLFVGVAAALVIGVAWWIIARKSSD